MAVSTSFFIIVELDVQFYQPLQHFQCLLYFHSIRTLGRLIKTVAIYANAIQSHTICSVPVMHVRESHGFCAPIPSAS